MSSIFHGGNTYIFYNTDAGNNIPTSIGYKNIDQLGAFPQVKINSSTTQFETYNDEWVQILSSQMSIDSVNIVVHYVPDNLSHRYLDSMFTDGTKFQIKVSLYEAQTSLDQHYVILSGYVTAYQDSADQNEIFDRTYTFTAEDVIARGTAVDPAPLKQGDYGVGSNGEDIPQYESDTPSGNSFIKVPATRQDNPLGVDLGGFAYVDNGGDQVAQFVISETGPINIYTKNTDNPWTLLPTKSQNDFLYVPVSRTINSYSLDNDIVLSKSDVGLGNVLNVPSYSKTESDSTFTTKTTTVNGYPLSANVTVSSTDVGLGNVLNVPSYSKNETDSLLEDLSNETDTKISDLTTETNAVLDTKVDKNTTVNGYDLSTDVTLTSTDTGSLAIANNLGDVANVTTARTNLVAAKSGVNSDITGLTALSGSLRLGGDASGDYDAVTLRQLLANSGGSSGPSMTGVMNNYLGAVSWFNGTRAKLPAGHLASDGQVLNRADYPEIWNAISTGMLQSATDAVWTADGANRGMYSTGDGTTTFRMPDLNGKVSGSIQGLFLRGDGTGYASGSVLQNALPNIVGGLSMGGAVGLLHNVNSATSGAFKRQGNLKSNGVPYPAYNISVASASGGGVVSTGGVLSGYDLGIDASGSSSSYGRDSTTEVRPNAATGVWVIRVNGKFSASSTNFNVITADTALPAAGTVVYGGDIRSAYQVAGSDYVVARLRATAIIGTSRGAVISLQDSSTGTVVNTDWRLPATAGTLVLSTDTRIVNAVQTTGSTMTGVLYSSNQSAGIIKTSAGTGPGGINYLGQATLNSNQYMTIDVTGTSNNIITRIVTWNTNPKVFGFYDNGNGVCDGQWVGGSDERHKSNIVLVPNALEAVLTWRGVTYDKKDGLSEVGLIAQDVEKDCPLAVMNTGKRTYSDGTVIEDFKSLNIAGVSAAYHTEAIKELYAIIQDLQSQINELNK